jgi:hypothetical protein
MESNNKNTQKQRAFSENGRRIENLEKFVKAILNNESKKQNVINSGFLNMKLSSGPVTDGFEFDDETEKYNNNKIVQDPAGSAIGTGSSPYGGGASGAIYDRFHNENKLAPIPDISETNSIFGKYKIDESNAPIIHTHSPSADGSPAKKKYRTRFIKELATSYRDAINLWLRQINDDSELNLVPLAGSIYAGEFRDDINGSRHLHPSYTLISILLAVSNIDIGNAEKFKNYMSKIKLWYFEDTVYDEAQKVWTNLISSIH